MVVLKLKELMLKENIGQRELSRITGIRQGTISDYCNNNFKLINKEHIDTLCLYFNCNVSDLMTVEKSNNMRVVHVTRIKD